MDSLHGRTTSSKSTFAIDGERPALIEPGVYDLVLIEYSTWLMFGRQPKVVLRFRVITYGDEFGKEVRKYYNATKLIRPYGKNGRFKVGFSSDLLRDFSRLHGKVSRLDRIPMTRFDDCIIAGEIATAMQGHDQQPIPADLQYSVVRKLIAVTARGQGSKNVAPEPAPKPTPTRNGGRP